MPTTIDADTPESKIPSPPPEHAPPRRGAAAGTSSAAWREVRAKALRAGFIFLPEVQTGMVQLQGRAIRFDRELPDATLAAEVRELLEREAARPPMIAAAIAHFTAGVLSGLADEIDANAASNKCALDTISPAGLREVAAAAGFDFVIARRAREVRAGGVGHLDVMTALYRAACIVVAPRVLSAEVPMELMLRAFDAQRAGDAAAVQQLELEAATLRRAFAWDPFDWIGVEDLEARDPAMLDCDVREAVRHLALLVPAIARVEVLGKLREAFERELLDEDEDEPADELVGLMGAATGRPTYPAWQAFLETREGEGATNKEREALARQIWPHGPPTVESYALALGAIRGVGLER